MTNLVLLGEIYGRHCCATGFAGSKGCTGVKVVGNTMGEQLHEVALSLEVRVAVGCPCCMKDLSGTLCYRTTIAVISHV